MQIKVAIFLEGYSELIFVKRLIEEYFTSNYKDKNVKIVEITSPESFNKLINVSFTPKEIIFSLILSHGEEGVLNSIVNESEKLIIEKGYNKVIGLRDVYNKDNCSKLSQKDHVIAKIDKTKEYVLGKLRRKCRSINIESLLNINIAIMEIEAWFLCEYTVFEKIDSRLTPQFINDKLKIDLINDDPEITYDCPSKIMKKVYKLVDKKYKKSQKRDLHPLILQLNFGQLLGEASYHNKIGNFLNFVNELDCLPT